MQSRWCNYYAVCVSLSLESIWGDELNLPFSNHKQSTPISGLSSLRWKGCDSCFLFWNHLPASTWHAIAPHFEAQKNRACWSFSQTLRWRSTCGRGGTFSLPCKRWGPKSLGVWIEASKWHDASGVPLTQKRFLPTDIYHRIRHSPQTRNYRRKAPIRN